MPPMNRSGSRVIGFCNQYVTINYNCPEAAWLVNFLCTDLPADNSSPSRATYDLVIVGKKPMLSLWQGEKQLYFGDCKYSLAYTLINEIIYQCITDNKTGHAIHAAAVSNREGTIILPGKSGCGKSTLTTWLVSQGCNYLTDELVLIAKDDHQIHPLTRPISIKSGSVAVLNSFLSVEEKDVLVGDKGFMLPHRLINNNFSINSHPLSCIIFPEYKAGVATELTRLTSGIGCSKLMECYVNARNIKGHGISQLAELTRNIPVYQLSYGDFDGLEMILAGCFQ